MHASQKFTLVHTTNYNFLPLLTGGQAKVDHRRLQQLQAWCEEVNCPKTSEMIWRAARAHARDGEAGQRKVAEYLCSLNALPMLDKPIQDLEYLAPPKTLPPIDSNNPGWNPFPGTFTFSYFSFDRTCPRSWTWFDWFTRKLRNMCIYFFRGWNSQVEV